MDEQIDLGAQSLDRHSRQAPRAYEPNNLLAQP